MRSGLLSLILSAVWWSVSLSLISLCGWIVLRRDSASTTDDYESERLPLFPPPTYTPEMQRLGRQTVWIKSLAILLGIGISITIGYGIRDYQLIKNSHTYFDVDVLEKYSSEKYLLRPARMQPWISKTCEPLDLTPGHTMKFYTYEQMADCHRVKSFEFYANSKGERVDASIQMR